jgi:vancomycin resistance protein YoaR
MGVNFRSSYHGRLSKIIASGLVIAAILLITISCKMDMFSKIGQPRAKRNVYLEGENIGGLTKQEILKKIQEHAKRINITAQNAGMEPSTWEISEGKPGLKVNIDKTLENVLNAEEGQHVQLVKENVNPEITNRHFESNIIEIAHYSTPIVDKRESRMNNINIAAEKINNKILQKGEEFSFNKVVGRRTEDKGYEYAPIIIKTEEGPKKTDAVGGGVCQLSTTLYNAVEECGLKITERHTHSSDVTYVPEGEDAAVSYGTIDFKFVNTREYPIMIKISVQNDEIVVKILENRNIKAGS